MGKCLDFFQTFASDVVLCLIARLYFKADSREIVSIDVPKKLEIKVVRNTNRVGQ